jgi:hypothetical protein
MSALRRPSKSILKLPLHRRALLALRAAVRKVYQEAARDGRSLYIWENDKVVELSPREIRRRIASRRRKK